MSLRKSGSRRCARSQDLAAAALALFIPLHAAGQAPQFQPAAIRADSVLHTLDVGPKDVRRADSVAVRCQAFIEVDGSLTQPVCDMDDARNYRRLLNKVLNVLADESFVAAKVDGRETRVLMNFALFVSCVDDACTSVPLPHHGFNLAQLGFDYVAPQAILRDGTWYDGFQDRRSNNRGPSYVPPNGRRTSSRFVAAVNVGADGVATNSCYVALIQILYDDAQQRSLRKLESILASLAPTRFVPGFQNGLPVPMRFYESNWFYSPAQMIGAARPRAFGDPGTVERLSCQ